MFAANHGSFFCSSQFKPIANSSHKLGRIIGRIDGW